MLLTCPRSGATARILPEAGFNCVALSLPVGASVVKVLSAVDETALTGENALRCGIPLLFPFPNRIRGGAYRWDGRDYRLDGVRQDGKGNAIHGLVIDRPWRIKEQRENYAVGQFQLSVDDPQRRACWPADFLIEVRYEVAPGTLRCDVRIMNPDQVALPWGFGTHPYFRIPLSQEGIADECLIQAEASGTWELVDCLPTGRIHPVDGCRDLREGQPLGGLKLDDVLTGLKLAGGRTTSVLMDPRAGLQVTQSASSEFRELVVYTPGDRKSVCLEPYTCVTDAVNLAERGIETGWQTLKPGDEVRLWFEISAGRIYV
jgi:aldose 1-epimerase